MIKKYMLFSFLTIILFGFDYWGESDWLTISDMRYVTRIAESNRFIYVSTTGGVLRWDKFSKKWLFPYSWMDIIGEERVYELFVSGSNLILRTNGGYYITPEPFQADRRFSRLDNPSGLNLSSESCPSIFPLYIPPVGFIFTQDGVIIDPYFNRYPVSFCYSDRSNNLWLGTWGLGIWLVDTRAMTMEPKPIGLADANVRAIFINPSGIWFGGKPEGKESGGITFWDRKSDKWRIFDARLIRDMGTNNVYDIVSNSRYTFFATDLGLLSFDNVTQRWHRYTFRDGLQDEFLTSLLLKGDTLFIGQRCGLSLLEISSMKIKPITPPDYPKVNKMAVFKGRVYVATSEGAFWFNGKGLTQIHTPDGYLGFRVYGVDDDSNGVWFVSDKGFLFLEPETGKIITFPREEFVYEDPFDMMVMERYIWLTTSAGVIKIRKEDMHYFRYTSRDGLVSNIVYTIERDGDYVWFGTDSGATRYLWNKPERIDW